MEKLKIHNEIYSKLNHFIKIKKIPNILFHGKYGSGKKTIVHDFINNIYNFNFNKDLVMFVNCSHGKGIKFIREELKFFAKTNVQCNSNNINLKIIVLSNADKLTIDAQSALRRCIEVFSFNTRFILIAEDKNKLMKPILSRFCELYIPEPTYKNKTINLNKYILNKTFENSSYKNKRAIWLKNYIKKIYADVENLTINKLNKESLTIYEKGFSSLDVMEILKKMENFIEIVEIYICHNKMRKEIRNEKILILMILNYIYLIKTNRNNEIQINKVIEKLSFI